MRSLLVIALALPAACAHESTARQPVGKTVVAHNDLVEAEQTLELAAIKEPQPFIAGCTLANVKGWAVLQCPELEVFAKFHCRNHTGADNALGLMLRADSYDVYCR